MKTVKHILQDKGHNIWHTTPDALVIDALKLMAEKEVGSLLVLDEGKLVGIISALGCGSGSSAISPDHNFGMLAPHRETIPPSMQTAGSNLTCCDSTGLLWH